MQSTSVSLGSDDGRLTCHLPHLRRFARAMTGNQRSGDTAVMATLNRISRCPGEVCGDGMDLKLALYRALLTTCGSLAGDHISTLGDPDPVDSRRDALLRLAPRTRQALLLSAIEGFTVEEGAAIIGVSPREFSAFSANGWLEIASQMATDVLIIEDEVFIARDLAAIMTSLGHRVIARARTHTEAIAALHREKPGLVLADVQLADGSNGIEAANEIMLSCPVPVIFITAFPERLLTGSRPEPAFLIAKPFSVDEVRAVVSQVLFLTPPAQQGHDDALAREPEPMH